MRYQINAAMDSHRKILGWTFTVLCGASLAIGMLACVVFWPPPGARPGAELALLWPVLLMAAYAVPGVAAGVGLLRGQAWARLVMIVLLCLMLPALPVGTAFGAYGLWVLLGSRVQRQQSFHLLVGKGAILLLIAGVAAGFAAVLQAGFWLHGQAAPLEVAQAFPFALMVLLLLAVLVATGGWRRLAQAGTPSQASQGFRQQASRPLRDFNTIERQRLADLAADPARRQYAERIRRGQLWSDAQIAYDQDPSRTVTCVHLRGTEQAMRQAGIFVRLLHGPVASAECRINLPRFAQKFGEATAALYEERHDIDRSWHDPKSAMFYCPACKANLVVVHPEEAAPGTPWFPDGPAAQP